MTNIIEEKFEKSKKEYEEILSEYKKYHRRKYLNRICTYLEKTADEENKLLSFIKKFDAVEAYPQKDEVIYCGSYVSAESIVFKNEEGYEKIINVVTNDFDVDAISVHIKAGQEKFFLDEDDNIMDETYSNLFHLLLGVNEKIYEKVTTLK